MTSPLRHRDIRVSAFSALALVAVLLAGCGGDDQAADGDGDGGEQAEVTFVAVDIDWEEAPEQLPAGETTLVLDNQGDLEHTLTIEGVGGEEPLVETGPGETAESTTELDPGTYTFYCNVPGHREAGMEGTFEVTE